MDPLTKSHAASPHSKRVRHDFSALLNLDPHHRIVNHADEPTHSRGALSETILVIAVAIVGTALSLAIARLLPPQAQDQTSPIPCLFGP